jgi:hypothetical protein
MFTITRRDRRNRRQAQFQFECLDDRLVLSAAGGVELSIAHLSAMEHRLETRLARLEAQNGEQVTPAMARIQTRLARIQAQISPPVAATIGGSASATTDGAPASPRDPHGLLPGHFIYGPNGQPIGATSGAVSASSASASTPSTSDSGGSASATTDGAPASPRDPHGLLPGHFIYGPNGQPIGATS